MVKIFLQKLISLALILLSVQVNAQSPYQEMKKDIDSLILANLPLSALIKIKELKQLATVQKNDVERLDAILYELNQTYQIEKNQEKNIAILNEEISKSSFPTTPILESILAETYWNYYKANRPKISLRNSIDTKENNFRNWDFKTFVNQTTTLYNKSLSSKEILQNIPINDYGIILTKSVNKLRPSLYDFLAHRALSFYNNQEYSLNTFDIRKSLTDTFVLDSDQEFYSRLIKKDFTEDLFLAQSLKIYQELYTFHSRKKDKDALADLELNRILDLSKLYTDYKTRDSLTLISLNNIPREYPNSEVIADVLYEAGLIHQRNQQEVLAHNLFKEITETFPESDAAQNAKVRLFQLDKPEINIRFLAHSIPNENILATIDFKNVKKAKYTIYKLTKYDLSKVSESIKKQNPEWDNVLEYLNTQKVYKTADIDLPPINNFKLNSTEIKIDPMPSGLYILKLTHEGIPKENIKVAVLEVSNLRVVAKAENDPDRQKILAVNSKTGSPIKNAKITVYKSELQGEVLSEEFLSEGKTDKNGFLSTKRSRGDNITVRYKDDIIYPFTRTYLGYSPKNDIPTDKENISLFLDRKTYRPGQTIHFKGIKYISSALSSEVCAGQDVSVVLSSSQMTFETKKYTTNGYGTFSGTFIIPANLLNGSYFIQTGSNRHFFTVEEYKRPSFSVSFFPVNEQLIPNDSVTVKGRALSYAGYNLQNAKVSYTIYKGSSVHNVQRSVYLADSTLTDKNGNFTIRFAPKNKNVINTFTISVDVTDISGETQFANTTVTVGKPSLLFAAFLNNENFVSDTLNVSFSLTDLNKNKIAGKVKAKIYRDEYPDDQRYYSGNFISTLTSEEYRKYFPQLTDRSKKEVPFKRIPIKRTLIKEYEFDILPKEQPDSLRLTQLKDLASGSYTIAFTGYNQNNDSVYMERYTRIITPKIDGPLSNSDWVIQQKRFVQKGEKAIFWVGRKYPLHLLIEVFNETTLIKSEWISTEANKYKKIEVPYNGEFDLKVSFTTVYNGQIGQVWQQITPLKTSKDLKIQLLSSKDQMQPGDKDLWKIRVTDSKDKPVKAEILISAYDISLDAINGKPLWRTESPFYYRNNPPSWSIVNSNYGRSGFSLKSLSYKYTYIDKGYSKFYSLNFDYFGGILDIKYAKKAEQISKKGNPSPVVYGEGPISTLDEVVVGGYGSSRKIALTGALPGVTVAESVNEVFTSLESSYPNFQIPLSDGLRKNFAETAFFLPDVLTNENGEAAFSFTLPESLTSWNFRFFAHTKDLNTALLEKKVIAQKPLMISANMPRFFREGDEISVVAKTVNTSENNVTGRSLLLFLNGTDKKTLDVFTGKQSGSRTFQIDVHHSEASKYRITIPKAIDSLTYRLSAYSDFYYDGEEKSVPVLSKMLTLSESKSFILNPGESRKIKIEDFLSSDKRELKSLTFSTQNNPILDIVFALPYLQKENSEYLSSNSLLGSFMTGQMALYIRKNYKYATIFPDSSVSKLKNINNSPWFNPSQVLEQQKTLIHLFKGTNAYTEQTMALNKLEKMQKSNGSFPWFESCIYEDRYITQNIVASLGKSRAISTSSFFDKQKGRIAKKALSYVDNELIKNINSSTSLDIQGWYARSFYKDSSALIGFDSCQTKYLDYAHKNWQKFTDYEKGLIAYTFINLDRNDLAQPILKSLKEKAIFSDVIGAYWPREQSFFLWNRAEIEKHSLMIELFGKQESEANFVLQLKKWLLLNKQANNWQTSNATMSACFALLSNGSYELEKNTIRYSTKRKLEPELQIMNAGKFTYTVPLVNDKPDFPIYEIYNPGKNFMIASFSQTFNQNLKDVKSHNNGLIISKKYFKKDSNGVLKEINSNNELHVGDKITVRLSLTADRAFEYIKLRDERPSGTEPTSVISKYYYLENLFYYLTPKDTGTDIFINHLPKGQYIIDYDLYCAQSGKFSSGISKAESLYAPEFGAYTSNQNIIIK